MFTFTLLVGAAVKWKCFTCLSIFLKASLHVKTTELTVTPLLLGHYLSDGLHPDVELDDPGDRWLTYNDSEVIDIQGASVCEQREKNAYVLFYQRRVRGQNCLLKSKIHSCLICLQTVSPHTAITL